MTTTTEARPTEALRTLAAEAQERFGALEAGGGSVR
jgi:hypothetical protein